MADHDVVSFYSHPKSVQSIIEVRDLVVKYQDNSVINGLNLDILKGKITAICGGNGCGKSSLLRTLAGLQKISSGNIFLNRKPLSTLPKKTLARELTLLSQFNHAPDGLTVRELVSYGRYIHQQQRGFFSFFKKNNDDDCRAVENALALTKMEQLSDCRVADLSGGQRQRAWIALALAQETKLILLDEPTTYLDIYHQIEILQTLRELNKTQGITMIWVLHDLNQAAAYSDVLVLMKEGEALVSGKPEQVITSQNLKIAFDINMDCMTHPTSDQKICLPNYMPTHQNQKKQIFLST